MRKYERLPQFEITHGAYRIQPVQDEHIEPIRRWRNQQMDVLRQERAIEKDEQETYFSQSIWPQMAVKQPAQILVTLLKNELPIAYGGFVHASWTHRRAELSFLADPKIARSERQYSEALNNYLTLIRVAGFERLPFNRLYLETYAIRTAHIAMLEANGFRHEGTMREHVVVDGKSVDSLIHSCLRREWIS